MDKSDVVVPKGQESFYDQFHFAPAVKDGDRLFCSGVIGIGPDGKASPDPGAQFTQAFETLSAVLSASGASFSDVVEMTTFHVGLQKHLGAFMKIKDEYVKDPYPAWTAIGITELAIPGAILEIKVVARLKR
jgi:enamine deaminase RidA (YjgF/YER057c/UK114 family)